MYIKTLKYHFIEIIFEFFSLTVEEALTLLEEMSDEGLFDESHIYVDPQFNEVSDQDSGIE